MKGTPLFPQCGFSSRAVAILEHNGVEDFHSVDVLQDQGIRQGIQKLLRLAPPSRSSTSLASSWADRTS